MVAANRQQEGRRMIQVWTWPTPNGHKVHNTLEELGLPYKGIPINIGKGDQFKPEFPGDHAKPSHSCDHRSGGSRWYAPEAVRVGRDHDLSAGKDRWLS
jgi:hypothetical protein